MEKIKKVLTKVMPDQLSAFIILGFVALAIFSTIAINYILQSKALEVSAATLNEQGNITGSVQNLTSVAGVNNIEELQKINEKELKESKKKEEKKDKKVESSTPKYYIKVNYGAQVVTIYTKDSKGKYTKPVKAMVCSTGTYTPTGGVYKVPAKIRWCHMIGDVWGQYCTQVVGDILFHSVPYTTKDDHSSLMYTKYDQLGTKASLGCIRLTCEDAKWIYDNCRVGTEVEFYSSSNPGPLGKPTARKISGAPKNVRGWDPTDPARGNPWPEYLKSLENKKDNEVANEIQNEVINDTVTENVVENIIQNEVINEVINDVIVPPEVNDIIQNDVFINEITNSEVNTVNDIITNTEVNSLV